MKVPEYDFEIKYIYGL